MRFKKYNNNPLNKKTSDCVIRAISSALNKSWNSVYNDLCVLGFELKTIPNTFEIYSIYLKDYEIITPKVKKGKKRIKVEDFKKGTYILKIANHITMVKDGILNDLWDCRKKCVYRYWIIKGECL